MSESTRKKAAKERYPEHFKISKMVINQLVKWLHRTDIPAPQTALGIVKFASVIRAFNLYKSINILLENDHWEDAEILARSMFELLLNLEEVVRDKESAEEKAIRYLRFQYLQNYIHKANVDQYNVKKGRMPKKHASKLADMDKTAKSVFSEFLSKNRKSEWDKSWCNMSVYSLAKNSKNRMRISHYKVIYSLFSDLSHSSPYSVTTAMSLGSTPEETEKLLEGHDNFEKENMTLVLSLSTTWLIEILFIGRSEIPLYDVKWNFDVLKRIYSVYGVEPPKLPDF